MNIALFTDSYKPYLSGVTVSVDTLAKALRKLGHKVFIFAPQYGGKPEEDVFRFPSLPTSYPGFRVAIPFSKKIMDEVPRLGIDVVHSHSPFQMGLLGRRVARKLRVPFVYTLHTLFDQYVHYIPILPKGLSKKLISSHLRNFCNGCDAVIVPSRPVKELAVKEGIRARLEIIPTGIDLEAAKAFTGKDIRRKHGVGKDDLILLYVGRMTKEKNIPFLFRAFRLILKEHANTRLMLVAGGPMEQEYRAFVKELGIAGSVIFVGQVKHPVVFDYYSAADIFVFASTTETQGLVVAEAFATGLPVVVVDAAGVSDVMLDGETGFLSPHEEGAFASKVLHLIRDEERRKRMSERALRHVKKTLSAESYARSAERIYKNLVG